MMSIKNSRELGDKENQQIIDSGKLPLAPTSTKESAATEASKVLALKIVMEELVGAKSQKLLPCSVDLLEEET